MALQTISEKTIGSKFKRLSYFHGMLLTEADFIEEQAYFREKMKLHNRLHGEGVVWGLKVDFATGKKDDDTTGTNKNKETVFTNKISIEPGLAFDAAGNEIVVSNLYSEDISAQLAFVNNYSTMICKNPSCQKNDEKILAIIHVGIVYGECPSNLSNQYITTCNEVPQEQYSRVREGFRLVLSVESIDNSVDVAKCKKNNTKGTEAQYCDGMIIELADIVITSKIVKKLEAGKDIEIEQLDHEIKDARDFNSERVLGRWECARRQVLQNIKLPDDVVDLTCFIGRNKEWVTGKLIDKDLTVDSLIQLSNASIEVLKEIRKAIPYVKKGTKVKLVVDNLMDRVLFILPGH